MTTSRTVVEAATVPALTAEAAAPPPPLHTVLVVAVHAALTPPLARHESHSPHGALPVAALNELLATQSAAGLHTVSAFSVQAVWMPVKTHVSHASHGALPVTALNVLPATQSLRYTWWGSGRSEA